MPDKPRFRLDNIKVEDGRSDGTQPAESRSFAPSVLAICVLLIRGIDQAWTVNCKCEGYPDGCPVNCGTYCEHY